MAKFKGECTVDGCLTEIYAKCLCKKHYQRARSRGTTEGIDKLRAEWGDEDYLKYILENVTKDKETDCWVWNKCVTTAGYGTINYKGKTEYIHRLLYKLMVGPIQAGKLLDHEDCISTACCNPEHLRQATRGQNQQHKVKLAKNNTTGYRNVYYVKELKNPYVVYIGKEDTTHYFGAYSTDVEANKVAIQKRHELFGEFAGLV